MSVNNQQTQEERLSLIEKIKELLKSFRDRLASAFTPRFSVLAEELQQSVNALEFNQDVTLETLDNLSAQMQELQKVIYSMGTEEDKLFYDMNNFLSDQSGNNCRNAYAAKFEYQGTTNYVFIDAWIYEQCTDKDGNFSQEDFEKLINEDRPKYFPDAVADDWFRVYQSGKLEETDNPEKLLHKVDVTFDNLSFYVDMMGQTGYIEVSSEYSKDDREKFIQDIIHTENDDAFNKVMEAQKNLKEAFTKAEEKIYGNKE